MNLFYQATQVPIKLTSVRSNNDIMFLLFNDAGTLKIGTIIIKYGMKLCFLKQVFFNIKFLCFPLDIEKYIPVKVDTKREF